MIQMHALPSICFAAQELESKLSSIEAQQGELRNALQSINADFDKVHVDRPMTQPDIERQMTYVNRIILQQNQGEMIESKLVGREGFVLCLVCLPGPPACLPACPPVWFACLLACLLVCQLVCLRAYCLPACLPACSLRAFHIPPLTSPGRGLEKGLKGATPCCTFVTVRQRFLNGIKICSPLLLMQGEEEEK